MINFILFALKFVFLALFYLLVYIFVKGILKDTATGPVEGKTMPETANSKLQLLNPQGNVVKEIIVAKQAVLGRSDNADLIIEDDFSSYTHAKVVREGQNYFLYDLKSTNGTYLNSAKVTKGRLNDGDIIAIGKTKVKFIK